MKNMVAFLLMMVAVPAFSLESRVDLLKTDDAVVYRNLAIGTPSPARGYALEVVGNVKMTGSQTGDQTLIGNQSVSGSRTEVPDTAYSSINVSTTMSPVGLSFAVVNASGTLTSTATPFISTTTAISGQVLTIMGGANVLTLQDNGTLSGSLLELGSTTRALGAGDILRLRYYGGKWYEEAFVNN